MNKKLPLKYLILFSVAIVLLLVSTISGARAALIESSEYVSDYEMYDIGITLTENNKEVGQRNYVEATRTWYEKNSPLLSNIPEDQFEVGKTYEEIYRVRNTGTIDEFIRVLVYKYWLVPVKDDKGNIISYKKDFNLDPTTIECTLNASGTNKDGWIFDGSDNGWIFDAKNSTKERAVLYLEEKIPVYNSETKSGETLSFMSKIKVNTSIKEFFTKTVKETHVEEKENKTYTSFIYEYAYDGSKFCLEIVADGVQTHNAEDAIKSTWGANVTVAKNADGENYKLTLNE